jgi:flagellar biosynthesis GTPase FlhF
LLFNRQSPTTGGQITMRRERKVHQQRIFDSTGLLPNKNWKTALLHIVLLVIVVFVTEISGVRADMVFDFQMKLAKKGNAEAQFKVGEMYEAGRGVKKNMQEAMKWINKAAAQGNNAASYKLLYHDLEKNGINTDNKTQLVALKSAAHAGDGYAQYYVGLMHSRGVGLEKNNDQALDWLGKASLVGVTAAEAEIVRVNESRAQWRASQEAERKAREQEQTRLKEEERKKLEAQREKEKRKQQETANRKKTKQEEILADQREAERIAAEKEAQRKRLIAQKEAEAEKQREAVMQKRKQKEQEKKVKFESDPCAGKSARFLSTCR